MTVWETHPVNPQKRNLDQVAYALNRGEVIILPTDTVYALTAKANCHEAVLRIYRLKNLPENKPLALYCVNFGQAAQFIRMDNNQVYRYVKRIIPGPYTLVFTASKNLPAYTLTKQKTVGIRIVDHPVVKGLLERLDFPLIGTSVVLEDPYLAYPEEIEDKYGKLVDGFVNCGPIPLEYSTILDCRAYPPVLLRQGKGVFVG
ncbi:MAG: L-threonylcarbamoyladenylate synthase [Leptospiraceae bacterium]|nr:L-threonylcarbamoyladenylate synthase [Leptospiraceae bacterium]MDW8305516.1 L-threonylcarbamoyladenylate synthase [Leptospiraceae bacterium]